MSTCWHLSLWKSSLAVVSFETRFKCLANSSVRPLRILHDWRRSQFGRVTMETGGSPKSRCSIFALLSSAARYSATPRTGMLPSTWCPKQEEKKTGDLLFGEPHQLHRRLEGSSAYAEKKKRFCAKEHSADMGRYWPIKGHHWIQKWDTQAGLCTNAECTHRNMHTKQELCQKTYHYRVFAQLLGLNHRSTLTTQLCLVAGGSSFYREQPLLPSYSSCPLKPQGQ